MARAKKTAAASPSTAPKRREIDVQEVEARVEALDKAKRRSYDIYEIEQRVYNLEKKGTPGPGPTPIPDVVEIIQGPVADVTSLACEVTASSYSGVYEPALAFTSGSTMWIANAASSYITFSFTKDVKLVAIDWKANDANRYAIPTKVQISDDGEVFTDATFVENRAGLVIVSSEMHKHWRLVYSTTDSPTYYAGMDHTTLYGVKGE